MESWEGKHKVVVQTKGTAKISEFYTIGNDPDDDGDFFISHGYPRTHDFHVHSLDSEDPEASWKDIGGILNCSCSYPSCACLSDLIFFFGAHSGTFDMHHSGTCDICKSYDKNFLGKFYDKKNGCWQSS